jgi:predicted peptidase
MNVRAGAALIVVMMVSTFAADEDAVKNQDKKTFKGRSVTRMEVQYLLFLPQGYKEDKKKEWPLMLFLHGAGERGSDLAKVTVHGPPKIVKHRADFPFIALGFGIPSALRQSCRFAAVETFCPSFFRRPGRKRF